MRIVAIDPGPEFSAWVVMKDGNLIEFGKCLNADARLLFTTGKRITHAVCERIRSYGMPAGAELFETCEWCGRFWEISQCQDIAWHWLTRNEIKNHLCRSSKAKDANIRQALIDRFGGKEKAIGKKANPGVLFGVSGDVWAALAVAVTWMDKHAALERIA